MSGLRRRAGALLAATVVAGVTLAAPPAAAAPGEERVRVIVQLAPGADPAVEGREAAAAGGRVSHVYRSAVRGFAATLPRSAVEALRRSPDVLSVEPDATVRASVEPAASWGLDRIDQRSLPLDSRFTAPDPAGAGVTAYIVDTGVAQHDDFDTRLAPGHTVIADGGGTEDCNGHGTHVAGTVGGTTYGVAAQVTLVPVRVLDCAGAGTWSGVIAGLDWIVADHDAEEPAVVNMSLGGARNASVDAAVNRVIQDGVTVVVAAGNSGADACGTSPARVGAALTTGATDRTDRRAPFSNFGRCLDLFAPGVEITSSWLGGTTGTISGTSMASPHVAGVAAIELSQQPTLTPAQVAAEITGAATRNVVLGAGSRSPNRLLFAG